MYSLTAEGLRIVGIDDAPAEQAVPQQAHQRQAWMDQKALEVARRFTPDDQPQLRAQLQVAVLEAMLMMPPGCAGGACIANTL